MDFLESAAVLIPALTGLPVTVYHGEAEALTRFESQYCFSPRFQAAYTAQGLKTFFDKGAAALIYDIAEPLGSRLAAFWAGDCWVLLGPYVEEGWNGGAARALLAKLGVSESAAPPYKAYRCKLTIAPRDYVLQTVRIVAQHVDGGIIREVRTGRAEAGEGEAVLAYPNDYEDSAIVNRRYAIEDRIMAAISRGDQAAAIEALKETKEVTADLRFISNDLAGAATLRTVARMGARQGGLSPVLIDSISQEYAQRMQHTVSKEELDGLIVGVVERFCAEVRQLHQSGYSPCVRRAMDYMGANLSRQLTVAEIVRAAGVDRHRLSKTFVQETGMTLKQYLAQQRCGIAAELLRSSGDSVQDIAAYVGYPDNNYFSKVFKISQGVSPQEYRKAHGVF